MKTCPKALHLKYGKLPDNRFNKTQLRMGIKTEHEHTNCSKLAKQIAKAHLHEIPNYYTLLNKMERQATRRH